jgi:hypothetical protein
VQKRGRQNALRKWPISGDPPTCPRYSHHASDTLWHALSRRYLGAPVYRLRRLVCSALRLTLEQKPSPAVPRMSLPVVYPKLGKFPTFEHSTFLDPERHPSISLVALHDLRRVIFNAEGTDDYIDIPWLALVTDSTLMALLASRIFLACPKACRFKSSTSPSTAKLYGQ